MRIVTNEKLAKRNRQIANYLFFFTLLVLLGSFALVNISLFTGDFNPDPLILVAQVMALPLAFILTLVSVRQTNLWARPPRPEDAIQEGLKGLSKKSILYNYYHIPARHVLIAPQGIFVIVTRWHSGKFSVSGDRWRSHQSAISKFFSIFRFDGIGNPTQEAYYSAGHLQKQLKDIAPDVDIYPLVVMVSPRAEVEMDKPKVPVLYANPKQKPNLKDFMRNLNKSQEGDKNVLPLTEEQIAAFEAKTLPANRVESEAN